MPREAATGLVKLETIPREYTMAQLHIEVVAADRQVWSGDAHMVIARTTEGELGVLPGHTPLLGVLGEGVVEIRPQEHGGAIEQFLVHGGFLSVADDNVSVLAEDVELIGEIDEQAARAELDRAIEDDDMDAARRARARLAAVSR